MMEATRTGQRSRIASRTLLMLLCLLALRIAEQTFVRTGLSLDGLEQYAHAQSWAWGYSLKQPPLYTWLLKLLGFVISSPLWAEVVLRQLLILIATMCVYWLARRGGLDQRLAIGSAAGMFVIVDYVYTGQATLTHTHAAVTAIAAALLAFHFVIRGRTALAYLMFGALCGAAILSKYLSVIPVAGILIAGAVHRESRSAVLHPRMLLAVVAIVATTIPHFAWWLAQSGDPEVAPRLWRASFANTIVARLYGMGGVLLAMIGECALLILAAGAAIFQMRRQKRASSPIGPAFSVPMVGFVVSGVAVTVAMVGISGATNIVMRWMLPLAVFVPLALMVACRFRHDALVMARHVLFVGVACAAVALVIGTIDDLSGGNRTTYDYRGLERAVTARTGRIDALLPLGDTSPLNISLYMRQEPVIVAFEQTRLPASGRVLLIWPAAQEPAEDNSKLLPLAGLSGAQPTCREKVRLEHAYGMLTGIDYCLDLIDIKTALPAPFQPGVS